MYADVIIDISHEKLDRVFQYRIPESLSTELEIGMQVVVPFGMGNKLQTGYVIDFSETTDYDPAKIKEIKRISTQAVPIESQLIQLSAWMRKNFGATMNQALKTVIPVKKKEQLQQKRTVVLAINDTIEAKNVLVELQRKHQTARARVLEALIEEGSIAYEILTKKLHVTAAVLRAMSEQGILRIESEDQLRNPVAHLQKKEYAIVLNEN